MPIGYLITVAMVELGALLALSPPPWHGPIGGLASRIGIGVNELAGPATLMILGSTALAFAQGDISSAAAWGVVVAALFSIGLLGIIIWRGLQTAAVVEKAVQRGLAHDDDNPALRDPLKSPATLARSVLIPFVVRRTDVERVKDVRYGPAGARNLLDVYRNPSRPENAPILVYWHGGGYFGGQKDHGALPMLYRLASRGWVCISANYRIRPSAGFMEHMVDAKRAMAWARDHAQEFGGDSTRLVVAGSSAGGHMAAISALTQNNPMFQPGFEEADTGVSGAILLGGYFGNYYGRGASQQPQSSPLEYDPSSAPPTFIAHGDHDSIVPVEQARQMAAHLRSGSSEPVVYSELPWGQHSFDLFHSPRFESVVSGIEVFADWIRSRKMEDA